MKFVYTDKNGKISDNLKSHAEKKLSKFNRFFKDDSEVFVVFSEEKGRQTVEVTIHHGTMFYRARSTTQDMRTSIDQTADALMSQIQKNKTKLEKRLRAGAFDRLPGDEETIDFEAEEESYDIKRSKRFVVKPISPEEAILQMNMLGHQFFIFKDLTNGDAFSVVYRRDDGGYGMIETE